MEYSYHFSRLRVQRTDSGRSTNTFPFMKVISILGNSLCFSKICCFHIHFVIFYPCRRDLQRMAAIMLQTIPSFYAKFSEKSLSISANTYEKYIVCKDYCIAHHNDKTCIYPLANITLYCVEKLRNCYIYWIHFVSPINTWTVYIPC